jgi:hypothetical protein
VHTCQNWQVTVSDGLLDSSGDRKSHERPSSERLLSHRTHSARSFLWVRRQSGISSAKSNVATATLRIGLRTMAVRPRTRRLGLATLLLVACATLQAQTTQFLPEVDTYVKINSVVRTYFQAKDDRDEGVSSQATLGPGIELYIKPLVKLKRITTFDLDDSKPRALVLEAGYRYVAAPNAPTDNRFTTSATSHLPLKGGGLITDKNRADLDWKGGKFYWRYRNKLTLERTFAIYSYHLIPYAAVEPYYTSQYSKWSTTAVYAGCLLPVGKHVEFNPYYEHENNTGKHPNQQTNSIGLALNLYFTVQNK